MKLTMSQHKDATMKLAFGLSEVIQGRILDIIPRGNDICSMRDQVTFVGQRGCASQPEDQ